MPYALYYATAPAPADLTTHDVVNRLVPVVFSTENYTAKEVEERCKPLLEVFKGRS